LGEKAQIGNPINMALCLVTQKELIRKNIWLSTCRKTKISM